MSIKVLGQVNLTDDTETTVYTVPSGKTAALDRLLSCNLDKKNATYYVRVKLSGETGVQLGKQLIYNSVQLPKDSTGSINLGLTLGAGDAITVQGNQPNLTFTVFGVEQ